MGGTPKRSLSVSSWATRHSDRSTVKRVWPCHPAEYKQADQAREELPQEARQAEAAARVNDPLADLPPAQP
jgi:hypothetical protein